MRQGKFRFLLVAMLVATGLLFAGGEARAAVFAYSISGDVTASGPSSATYTYTLAKTGDTTLSYVDFEIPAEIILNAGTFPPAGDRFFSVAASGATAGNVEIYNIGIGDFGTKFGVGDTRYRVMKVNIVPPTSNQPFTITITLKGQTFQNNRSFGDFNQSEKGAILIKAGNGSNTLTFTTAPTPTVVNPPPPPIPPTVSFFNAIPATVESGQCITLTWSSAGEVTLATINPGNLEVGVSGNLQVCPTATTVYILTLTGPGGTAELTVTATVNAPAAPAIEVARETIEKKDANGQVIGYVTFYFVNGAPACSCVTQTNDQILAFPCEGNPEGNPLPENCHQATDSDTNPVLVCLPFPGRSYADLLSTCGGRPNCGVLEAVCKDGSGNPVACFAKCDILEAVTDDTTMQIGQNTCCAKTSYCRTLSGAYRTCTTWVPCSGTSTCP